MRLFPFLIVSIVLALDAAPSKAAPVTIVAAENFYGDVASQVGGPAVAVTSILNNPGQDPHLFEVSPSAARAVSAARIVIYNGIGYDSWMERLVSISGISGRKVIIAADLVHRRTGDNPHIWYDVNTMSSLADTLADALISEDPGHKDGYQRRLKRFMASLVPIRTKIAALRKRLAGVPVAATEPVLGYLLEALGMKVLNPGFQLEVMNNVEPSASNVASFESDLKHRRVRLLIFNKQTSDPVVARLLSLARSSDIPAIGAAETMPPGLHYQDWILEELGAIDRAPPGRGP